MRVVGNWSFACQHLACLTDDRTEDNQPPAQPDHVGGSAGWLKPRSSLYHVGARSWASQRLAHSCGKPDLAALALLGFRITRSGHIRSGRDVPFHVGRCGVVSSNRVDLAQIERLSQ